MARQTYRRLPDRSPSDAGDFVATLYPLIGIDPDHAARPHRPAHADRSWRPTDPGRACLSAGPGQTQVAAGSISPRLRAELMLRPNSEDPQAGILVR